MVFGRTIQKCWGVGRKEVFYYWPFGLVLWLAGVIFIDRNNGKKSNMELAKTMELVRSSKVSLRPPNVFENLKICVTVLIVQK